MMTAALPARVDEWRQSPGVDKWRQIPFEGTVIIGKYVNYAEGFSIAVPRGLVGRRGQAAGPERGVSIPLSPDCEGRSR